MAKTVAKGYTDTAIGGYGSNAITTPALNYLADFSVASNVPGEVVLTNATSPYDQQETVRFAQRKVANVYAGTDISPASYLPSQAGTSTLVEVREVWSETSSTDEAYRRDMPVRCGISFTLPSTGSITATQALDLVKRTFSALLEQGVATDTGMNAILRGVLLKKNL